MRLIDADKIEKFIQDGLNNPDRFKAFGHDAVEILTEVHYAPTIEVVPKWISVEDRLPEQPGVFLVITKSGNQSVQWFHMVDKKWPVETYEDTLRYFGDVSQHEKVTHWMPLPEPPTTVAENETVGEEG